MPLSELQCPHLQDIRVMVTSDKGFEEGEAKGSAKGQGSELNRNRVSRPQNYDGVTVCAPPG